MSNFTKAIVSLKEVILITVTMRLILIVYGIIVSHSNLTNWYLNWVRWDGPHYIDLARIGYQPSGEISFFIVFYPLYPLLIKLVSLFINNFELAAILISILFSFSASIFLYKVVLLDFSKRVALLSVWFLNIFPTAYFLQASYTESLFLTLSLATIYFLRKDQFLMSGFGLFLSTFCRVNGLLLIPILLFEKKLSFKLTGSLIFGSLGFLLYLLINYLTYHDPLFFSQVLSEHWYKELSWPWVGINNLFNSLPAISQHDFYLYFSEIVSLAIILIFGIISLFIRLSYGIYILISWLLFSSTTFVLSTPRYGLSLFPIFICLALVKNRIVLSLLSGLCIIGLMIFTNLYVNGQWAF